MFYIRLTARSFRDGTPFTVPCGGREARFLHRSHRELNPGPSRGSPLHHRIASWAPFKIRGPHHERFTDQSKSSICKAHVRGAQLHIVKHLKSLCRPHWHRLARRLPLSYHEYFSTGLFYLIWRILADAYTWISNIMCKLSKPSLYRNVRE